MSNDDSEALEPIAEQNIGAHTISVGATKDRLKLFVSIKRIPDSTATDPVTIDSIRKLLSKTPNEFIHGEIIEKIAISVGMGEEVERRRVAKGIPAEDGKAGKLLLLVKKYAPIGRQESTEFIDARFMRTFDNIEKGTIVARVYAPTAGTNGKNVLGETIPANPGKPIQVKIDAKTLKTEPAQKGATFDTILAEVPGYITEESGTLIMKPELSLGKSIDYKTGDIDFIGNVAVRGDVQKDFRVRARGDIKINGNVFSASVESMQGSVEIVGSASGSLINTVSMSNSADSKTIGSVAPPKKANLFAAKQFTATTLQGVSVEALGHIVVKKAVQNCYLHTRGSLIVNGGILLGGEAYVVCGVEADIIGSDGEAVTKIVLCSDVESSVEYVSLQSKIHSHEEAEHVLKLHLGPYATYPTKIDMLHAVHQKKMREMLAKLKSIEQSKRHLISEREEILKTAKHNHVLRVNFKKMFHPGSEIHVGEKVFAPKEAITGPKTIEFFAERGEFEVSEVKPLECAIDKILEGQKKPEETKKK